MDFFIREMFQHTAARRRLVPIHFLGTSSNECFNTQPPEDGWLREKHKIRRDVGVSTHSRPKTAGCNNA